jgi:hypothetical protein
VLDAIDHAKGNRTAAAKALGMSVRQIQRIWARPD